ncbi:MAG: hypothetical protein ACKVS8_13700 [Phycisphaerales bacterium]
MNATAKAGLLLVIVSGVVFVASVWVMAQRVSGHNLAEPPSTYLFTPVWTRAFTAFGKPVTLTDDTDADGNHVLRVKFGDSERLVRVHRPPAVGRPELDAYQEWLSLLAFAPMTEGRVVVVPGEPDARLVIVWRIAAPGQDDAMGGLKDRNRWTFGLVEFQPDGTLSERLVQFPDKRGTGKLRFISDEISARVEPIAQRSWEWQAALFVIPKLHISNYRYNSDAVESMGWTLPGAGLSMLGALIGLMVWGVGSVPRVGPRPLSDA